MASRQAVIFGIMPPLIWPVSIRVVASETVTDEIRLRGSVTSSSTPGTSVSMMNLSAFSAPAMAAAAVSALML